MHMKLHTLEQCVQQPEFLVFNDMQQDSRSGLIDGDQIGDNAIEWTRHGHLIAFPVLRQDRMRGFQQAARGFEQGS